VLRLGNYCALTCKILVPDLPFGYHIQSKAKISSWEGFEGNGKMGIGSGWGIMGAEKMRKVVGAEDGRGCR
jgi:hypothetical protein